MKYSLFLMLLAMVGCSTPTGQLTEAAQDLEVYTTRPANCPVVARVVGRSAAGSRELAVNEALNQAAKLQATGIFVNEEVPNGNSIDVHATAYKCQ